MERIRFAPGKQQEFFKELYLVSNFSTKQLARIANVHTRTFNDWRRGKLTMTLKAAELFCKMFKVTLPEPKTILIERWKKSQSAANKIGGISQYKKNGTFATQEGRSRGGKNAIYLLQQRGLFPKTKSFSTPYYCTDLAEFIGILLGDGGLTQSMCSITLNSEADAQYIFYVQNLSEKLFGYPMKVYYRKNEKTCILYYNSVELVRYLTANGLFIGNKVKQQVTVPSWIKENPEFRRMCLRGLVDTDGGIFVHTYKIANKQYSYHKLCFTNKTIPLIEFVYESLQMYRFTPKIMSETKLALKRVWLYNDGEIHNYLSVIGTSNNRLLNNKESCQSGNGAAC